MLVGVEQAQALLLASGRLAQVAQVELVQVTQEHRPRPQGRWWSSGHSDTAFLGRGPGPPRALLSGHPGPPTAAGCVGLLCFQAHCGGSGGPPALGVTTTVSAY